MIIIRWLAAILLLTASLGQLNRLFIGDSADVVLYLNDVLIGALAVWYIMYVLIARKSWEIPQAILPVFGWVFVAVAGLILARGVVGGTEWLISWSYLVRYVAYVLVFFFVAFDSLLYDPAQWRRRFDWWIGILLASGLLMAIGGFIQLYLLPDLAELAKYGWDPHVDRLVTAMLDPNYAGCYFAIIIGVAVSLYLHMEGQLGRRALLLLLISVLMVALLLTYSRSGYLMLAVVLGCISVVKSRALLVVGLVLAIIAVMTVPRIQTRLIGALEVDASAQPRIISWQNSWQIGSDNWMLGVGFNAYRYAQDRYGIVDLEESGHAGAGADSSWLFVFATTGILGALLFVSGYMAMIWAAMRTYFGSSNPRVRAVSLATASVLVGLAMASQFNNALFYTWIMQPLWLLCGICVALFSANRSIKTGLQ